MERGYLSFLPLVVFRKKKAYSTYWSSDGWSSRQVHSVFLEEEDGEISKCCSISKKNNVSAKYCIYVQHQGLS